MDSNFRHFSDIKEVSQKTGISEVMLQILQTKKAKDNSFEIAKRLVIDESAALSPNPIAPVKPAKKNKQKRKCSSDESTTNSFCNGKESAFLNRETSSEQSIHSEESHLAANGSTNVPERDLLSADELLVSLLPNPRRIPTRTIPINKINGTLLQSSIRSCQDGKTLKFLKHLETKMAKHRKQKMPVGSLKDSEDLQKCLRQHSKKRFEPFVVDSTSLSSFVGSKCSKKTAPGSKTILKRFLDDTLASKQTATQNSLTNSIFNSNFTSPLKR